MAFDGTGQHLKVGDSSDINTGGPYSGKTLAIVFETGSDVTTRQIIWEQGGGTRGLSFYLDSGRLYINGWNLGSAEPQWGPTGLNAPVSPNTAYLATLVMDADSGVFEGFLNGVSIGRVYDIDRLYKHPNDCAIGHVEGATRFHDNNNKGPADFAGLVAELHVYNLALPTEHRQVLETSLMNKYGLGD